MNARLVRLCPDDDDDPPRAPAPQRLGPTSKHAIRYSPEEIARVKAAAAIGVPSRFIAEHTGIGYQSIANWRCGAWCKEVLPDPEVEARIIAALRGE